MAMKNNNTVYLGTELKLKVGIEPMGGLHMSEYDFEVEAYCNEKSVVTASKKEGVLTNLVENDEDSYLALIDTSKIGAGKLKCRVIAYIKDNDFSDFLRTEVDVKDTGITILK